MSDKEKSLNMRGRKKREKPPVMKIKKMIRKNKIIRIRNCERQINE